MTHPTKVRTYDRETWLKARDAWDRGSFGSEWPDWRGMAAKVGIIFPPDGSAEDSWTDRSPSQRAIIIRAIRETPRLLKWALRQPGVASWGDVIGHLLTGRDKLGLEADEREAEWSATKRAQVGQPTRLAETLAIVVDSLGSDRG